MKFSNIIKNIFSKSKKGNLAYYPGCLTRFVGKDLEENYIKILDYLNLDYIVVDQIKCCGLPSLNAGYEDVFKEQINKVIEYFSSRNIKKIVTNCPSCYHTFKYEYPKYNNNWNQAGIEVMHISQLLNQHINSLSVRNLVFNRVTYHDPCHLGRYSKVYDEPRKVIKKCVKELKEMYLSKEKSFCCGGGAGLRTTNRELSNNVAKKRVSQAEEIDVDAIITSCPLCYLHLKENSKDLPVLELSHLLVKALEL
ncbi:MAG: fumarate reductase (CoM/CoB) subunit [Candidatus Woesearchaeota archaeon]|nr:fumarate reductase (CoM/CoB) subunit [Candidatus Woesearchaeota archaeon]